MRKLINRQKNAARKAIAALAVGAMSVPVWAVDTKPVDDAKADMLAFLAAMLTLAVAVWGGKKVMGLFGR